MRDLNLDILLMQEGIYFENDLSVTPMAGYFTRPVCPRAFPNIRIRAHAGSLDHDRQIIDQ